MKALKTFAAALATITLTACTMHRADAPPSLTGPSGAATTVSLAANPDTINHDGGSASRITVTVFGPNGKPFGNSPPPPTLRLDMFVNGVQQDYGTLSARTVVPNSAGEAFAVFTAPPPPPGSVFPTCLGLAGTCVEIVATPIGTDFGAAAPQSVLIRLVPPGVILPPAGTPTAAFAFSPSPVTANVPVVFDASASQPGTGATQIADYSWNFGDGTTGSGRTVTHTFLTAASHTVTLTVTNDRGLSASNTQVVVVGSAALPTASFTYSPTTVRPVIDRVFFNAATSTAATGRAISSYAWDFGDGESGSGVTTSHPYALPNAYVVTLTVTDDLGQKGVTSQSVTVAIPAATP